MTNLESTSERLNTSRKWSLKTERELSHLKSNTNLSNLKSEIKKNSNAWKFEFKNISRDWKYKVYLYTIEKRWTPSILKYQAVKRGIAKSKDQIKITNKDWVEYKESHKFSAWDKIYVKIETKPQAKPQVKPQERPQVKPQTKPQAKPNPQRIDVQQPNTWKFEYKNTSSDWKFEVYSYIVDQSTTTQWEILNKAKKELNLNNIRWLEITNSKWTPYKSQETFKVWEKIYLKIPVSIENNIQIIDGMKRKWWEYFWIDVSRFNNGIGRNKGESDRSYKKRCDEWWDKFYTEFEKWNRWKWNSRKKDVRWTSFVYIRAWDWMSWDVAWDKESIRRWTNFIKKHNNDRTIKNNHEQIATGFYRTLTNKKNIIAQANDFLKIYNSNKNTSWWHSLVPMLDLETDRFTEVKRRYKDKRGKTVVERYKPQEFKENALKRLQYVEKKTWIVPGLYIWAKAYGSYIRWDSRFNKYLTWLTAYPSEWWNGRENWTARRINFKEWSVNVWSSWKPVNIKPDMYQSSQEWTVPWTSAVKTERDKKTYHDTDMDHTKDITKLFSKNNKSK